MPKIDVPRKEHKIKNLGEGRYKSQRGEMVATFHIDDNGGITFFDGIKSDGIKSFKFHSSTPIRVKMLASLLMDAVKQSQKLQKDEPAN